MSDCIAIFGAPGDLTSRYLVPALAHLAACDLLDPELDIVGVDRRECDTDHFRAHITSRMPGRVPRDGVERVCNRLSYARADVTNAADVKGVLCRGHRSLVVYLALPAAIVPDVVDALRGAIFPTTA